MPIVIGSDAASQISQRSVNEAHKGLRSTLTRLASGHRINSAMDDAAGLAISENIQAQLRSLNQARRNTFDGISLVDTADAGLQESSELLGRMRELAMQASNGVLNEGQQSAIQTEFQQLAAELDRQAATTEYNGKKLLDGSLSQANGGLEFQVGIRDSAADSMQVTIEQVSTSSLQIDSTSVETPEAAREALADLDVALNEVTRERANLGSLLQSAHHSRQQPLDRIRKRSRCQLPYSRCRHRHGINSIGQPTDATPSCCGRHVASQCPTCSCSQPSRSLARKNFILEESAGKSAPVQIGASLRSSPSDLVAPPCHAQPSADRVSTEVHCVTCVL